MAERKYIDLKLWIGPPSTPDAVASVMLLPSPEIGEVLTAVSVSLERGPGPELLQGLRRKTLSPQQLIDLGERMADCFLPAGEIRECFLDAYKRIGQGGLRIRLLIADPALRTWPWEYVYLPRTVGPASSHGFLVLDPRVSLVRHEPLSRPHAAVEARDGVERDWRALLVGASPSSRSPLDVDHELDNILEALRDFEADGLRIACDPVLRQATLEELNRATLKPGSAHLFHFAGHGVFAEAADPYAASGMASMGYLLLLSDKATANERRVSAENLSRMLTRSGVRLAVLGACETGRESETHPWHSISGALIAHDIPAVVAMQLKVEDGAAVEFSRLLYTGLAAGLSLDEAVSLGRLAMLQEAGADRERTTSMEWGIPVLYSRLPDGALFPERMSRAGHAAAGFRALVRQTVQTIEEGGEVTGESAVRLARGFRVKPTVDRRPFFRRHWKIVLSAMILSSIVAWFLWSWVTVSDALVPGFGFAFPSQNRLDADLAVAFRPCTEECLPGVRKIAEMRGSLGIDSFAVLDFWKPGGIVGFWYAEMPGPTLKIRMAGYTPDLGIEITVKDSNSDEARFGCSVPPDGKVHDYVLPQATLEVRRVDLSRVQLIALGPSTSAKTAPGRFELKLYGMVPTQDTAGLEKCVGLLKTLPAGPEPVPPPKPRPTTPTDTAIGSGPVSEEFVEKLAGARALLHKAKYGEACREFEKALRNPPPEATAINREEISKARAEYERDNFQESARHFEKAFSAVEGRQP